MKKEMNVSQLNKIVEGAMPREAISFPFAIIRDSITYAENIQKRHDRIWWKWYFITSDRFTKTDRIKNEIEIPRRLAKRLIEMFDMSKVYEMDGARLYEMPGQPYLEKYSRHKEKQYGKDRFF